jgi:DHA2 family multidrug resistance protein-like MFS transporter
MTKRPAAADTSAPPDQDGLPTPRRYFAMLSIGLALTLAVLDSAIANVALPTIARDLNATAAASIWVVNAYQLAIVMSLLPLAALGEIIGYRRVYQAGLVLFTLASLACSLSRTMDELGLARILQGFGAAGLMSVNGALVRFIYPQAQLGRAIGINAMVVSVAAALGPTAASAILSVAKWPWLFGINVPTGVLAIAVASFALPRTPTADRRFDWPSALLNAAAFGFVVAGAEVWGRGEAPIGAIAVIIGLLAGALLILRELPRHAPLVPFDLLRIPIFGLSIATSVCSFTAQMLAYVSLPFYFETVLRRSAVETGLLMTPWPLAVGVAAPIAGHLADRYPAGLLGAIGLGVMALGLGLLAFMPVNAGVVDICWRMAVCGAGFGIFQSPNNRAMLSAAPRRRSGAAGGMLATARLIGQTAGAGAVAIAFRMQGREDTNLSLIIAAVVALVAAGMSSLRLSEAARASARAAS